ncbi:T9SS type A sorting domain-containing protein [Niastella populi]|uniref:Secretion system C-terminal sorting domain-containing protein n=1 Tax=Niastella populi TaxID=550983 RepID=A0A1V9G3M4_9BACT|nr:T9SS type A sorting domain-containing protein [Niastella populi]OQP65066.1 hypothetical protein A4R26_15270 [Niastella populi]
MPRSLQLNIAEPCHENWQNMTPQEQGRFCGSCQKTVVDFTMMSDQEVLNYFLKADHNVCGRMADDQLNRELKITETKKRFSWAYVWNILVATFLMTKADAQVKDKPEKPVEIISEDRPIMGKVAYGPRAGVKKTVIPVEMKGLVLDERNNQPVMGASIRVKDAGIGCMADTAGKFTLKVEKTEAVVLEFSAIGYETQTLEIDALANRSDIQVALKPAVVGLAEVTVNSSEITKRCNVRMGGVSYRVTHTRTEKIKSNINDLLPKKDTRLYPNPVVRGNSLQILLSLKQAGAYKLEVLNAAGQVMQVQPLLMQTKEQVIDLHTQVAWSAGIYWLRISSPDTKNVYQSKLLLQ